MTKMPIAQNKAIGRASIAKTTCSEIENELKKLICGPENTHIKCHGQSGRYQGDRDDQVLGIPS
jgi:hypothetical protein